MILWPTFAIALLFICLTLIFIPLSGTSSQNQCPSELASILYTFSSGHLLLDNSNYIVTVPSDWDSSNKGTYYRFTPCQGADVYFDLERFPLDPSLSTEQIAKNMLEKYAQRTEGYRILNSGYLQGASEYSVAASVGDSEKQTIWHAFIPIGNGQLIVTTFEAESSDLFEKYGGIARSIYDSISTVTESQKAELIQMVSGHNQFMNDAMTDIQKTRQKALDNWLGIMQEGVEHDRKINEENEKYQKEREQGLRP